MTYYVLKANAYNQTFYYMGGAMVSKSVNIAKQYPTFEDAEDEKGLCEKMAFPYEKAVVTVQKVEPIKLYAEIKDKKYADVDNWHFIINNNFETKDALKESLENGGAIVNKIFNESEYLQYLRSIDTLGMDEEELENLHLTIQRIEENLNYECLVSNGDCWE